MHTLPWKMNYAHSIQAWTNSTAWHLKRAKLLETSRNKKESKNIWHPCLTRLLDLIPISLKEDAGHGFKSFRKVSCTCSISPSVSQGIYRGIETAKHLESDWLSRSAEFYNEVYSAFQRNQTTGWSDSDWIQSGLKTSSIYKKSIEYFELP